MYTLLTRQEWIKNRVAEIISSQGGIDGFVPQRIALARQRASHEWRVQYEANAIDV